MFPPELFAFSFYSFTHRLYSGKYSASVSCFSQQIVPFSNFGLLSEERKTSRLEDMQKMLKTDHSFFSLTNAEKNEARLICNTVVVKSLPSGKRQIMHHGKKFLNGNMDFHSTKKKCSFMWMDDKLQRKKKCGRMPLNASLVSFPQCNMKCASVAGWVYNFRIFTMNLPWKIFSSFRFPRYF